MSSEQPPQQPMQEGNEDQNQMQDGQTAGRRHRRHSKHHRHHKNSWLSHVKATMKLHRGKSFKQILKLAKKSYKKSQSNSQQGGKRRKSQHKNMSQQGGKRSSINEDGVVSGDPPNPQRGGSSPKTSNFAENASAYP